jgi:uncharacterized protein YPO0396
MADLNDLKGFAEALLPILKDLFQRTAADADKVDRQSELAVIGKLRKLVEESSAPTPASLSLRSEAIVSVRNALTEVLVQAATNNAALPETTVQTIQAQRNALRNKFGLLLERTAFADIPQLLSGSEITRISAELDGANQEIQQRQKAKQTLDTIVKVTITAANIASKLA